MAKNKPDHLGDSSFLSGANFISKEDGYLSEWANIELDEAIKRNSAKDGDIPDFKECSSIHHIFSSKDGCRTEVTLRNEKSKTRFSLNHFRPLNPGVKVSINTKEESAQEKKESIQNVETKKKDEFKAENNKKLDEEMEEKLRFLEFEKRELRDKVMYLLDKLETMETRELVVREKEKFTPFIYSHLTISEKLLVSVKIIKESGWDLAIKISDVFGIGIWFRIAKKAFDKDD